MNNQRKEDQYQAQAEQFAAAAAEDGDVVNQADAIADTNLGAKAAGPSASDDDQAAKFAAAAAEDGDVVNDADAIADTNLGQ